MNNIYTPKEWQKFTAMHNEMETFAKAYTYKFISSESFVSVDVVGDILIINTEQYYYGGTACHSHDIPLAWLSDPDIMKRCERGVWSNKQQNKNVTIQ